MVSGTTPYHKKLCLGVVGTIFDCCDKWMSFTSFCCHEDYVLQTSCTRASLVVSAPVRVISLVGLVRQVALCRVFSIPQWQMFSSLLSYLADSDSDGERAFPTATP